LSAFEAARGMPPRRARAHFLDLGSSTRRKLLTCLQQCHKGGRHVVRGADREEASLVGTKHLRLRVGVIGLGRLWETRHKPSLARLADRFRVTAVYDPVFRRAELEAAQIGCAACEGLSALVQRPDVDVIYVLSRHWFGLHPIGLACAAGKAVYCALPLAADLDELESLARQVEQSGIVFMPEFARRCYPATLRLKELLATQLGPPRLILGHSRLYGFDRYALPGPTTQITPAPLLIDPGSYLLDWCCFVFQALPADLRGFRCQVISPPESADQESDFESFAATFSKGATAHISFGRYHRGPWGDAGRFLPAPGFQVFAERGAAWLEMPEKIQWSSAAATKEERLALEPTVGDVLNDQFHRLVRGDQSLAPTIREALEIARLISKLRRNQWEAQAAAGSNA
jgi:predicted dehydrogenase